MEVIVANFADFCQHVNKKLLFLRLFQTVLPSSEKIRRLPSNCLNLVQKLAFALRFKVDLIFNLLSFDHPLNFLCYTDWWSAALTCLGGSRNYKSAADQSQNYFL